MYVGPTPLLLVVLAVQHRGTVVGGPSAVGRSVVCSRALVLVDVVDQRGNYF